jgi:hypothetical protein
MLTILKVLTALSWCLWKNNIELLGIGDWEDEGDGGEDGGMRGMGKIKN